MKIRREICEITTRAESMTKAMERGQLAREHWDMATQWMRRAVNRLYVLGEENAARGYASVWFPGD